MVEPDVDRKRSDATMENPSYVSGPELGWSAGPVACGLQGRYCSVADASHIGYD